MANTIVAGNGTNNGLAVTSDNTGALNILTGSGSGTAAISIDSSQVTTFSAGVSGTTGSFSGNMSFNSGYGSAAVAYGCRAWVNFNGTGTIAIRGSGNVTSITDNNTGDYTVNFTTALTDTNYAVVGVASSAGTSATNAWLSVYAPSNNSYSTKTTSAVRMISQNLAGSTNDSYELSVSIFR